MLFSKLIFFCGIGTCYFRFPFLLGLSLYFIFFRKSLWIDRLEALVPRLIRYTIAIFISLGRRACPHLPRLKYGFSTGQQFWEGKRVLFHCKAGYRLSGPSEIFCNENGTWTGDQPTCSQGSVNCLLDLPVISNPEISSIQTSCSKQVIRIFELIR